MATPTILDLQADIDAIKVALTDLGVPGFLVVTSDTPVSDAAALLTTPPQT